MPSDTLKPRLLLLGLCAISLAVIAGMTLMLGLRVEYGPILSLLLIAAAVVAVGSGYCQWRNIPELIVVAEIVAALLILSPSIVVSTYLAMRVSLPLADAMLAGWDAQLHVDWQAFVRGVDAAPGLAGLLGWSYTSFAFQLFALPLAIALLGHARRAYISVICYGLIGFVSALISVWFPAVGTYAHYDFDPSQLSSINAYFGFAFLDQFNAVRNDPDFVLSLAQAAGIVTFPSVHAAVAVLCVWTAWPVGLLRYPALLLNILMAISALSHGSHYFIDVIAGIALAFLLIIVVAWISQRNDYLRHAGATGRGRRSLASIGIGHDT